MTLRVDGAQANIFPPITPARPEKTPLKVDHARTRLLSVLLALATTTPVSPNAPHALQPLRFKWTPSNFPPLVFSNRWIVLVLWVCYFFRDYVMWKIFSLPFLPIVIFPWGGLPFACGSWCAVGDGP